MKSKNPVSANKQRVMIIVWKWQDEYLEGGSKSTDNPDSADRLYCLWDEGTVVDLQSGFNAVKKKVSEIAKKDCPEADIYVFLHRTAGYTEERIRQIEDALKDPKVSPRERLIKCYSFGQGRDYLYIGVNLAKETGLLGQVERSERGNMQGVINKTLTINALTPDSKIKYAHFDDVWRHYTHQFKNKIFDLKEELLIHFCALCNAVSADPAIPVGLDAANPSSMVPASPDFKRDKGVTRADLYKNIKKENEFLYLKMQRFIEMNLSEAMQKKLYTLDREAGGESMVFEEGCKDNLRAIYSSNVVKAYENLQQEIMINLAGHVESPKDQEVVNPNDIMANIRDLFQKLLEAIPGKNYY